MVHLQKDEYGVGEEKSKKWISGGSMATTFEKCFLNLIDYGEATTRNSHFSALLRFSFLGWMGGWFGADTYL